MKGAGAEEGEAVDVTEVDFSGEKEECAEEEKEKDGAGEVGVVHEMLVDVAEGVEDGEGLVLYVSTFAIGRWVCSKKANTFAWICPKFTPSSSINGGSPSYPSVENAASHPVLRPPCSPILPETPAPNPGDEKPPEPLPPP